MIFFQELRVPWKRAEIPDPTFHNFGASKTRRSTFFLCCSEISINGFLVIKVAKCSDGLQSRSKEGNFSTSVLNSKFKFSSRFRACGDLVYFWPHFFINGINITCIGNKSRFSETLQCQFNLKSGSIRNEVLKTSKAMSVQTEIFGLLSFRGFFKVIFFFLCEVNSIFTKKSFFLFSWRKPRVRN